MRIKTGHIGFMGRSQKVVLAEVALEVSRMVEKVG
jgi:hypothetical protein